MAANVGMGISTYRRFHEAFDASEPSSFALCPGKGPGPGPAYSPASTARLRTTGCGLWTVDCGLWTTN
jgi:hypothetical protein